jgi:heptaprenyl diphosphate synthase
MNRSAKTITLLGVCTAAAMVLSYVETLIPVPFAVPGVKLGLANLVAVFLLMKFDWRYAAPVSLIRVLLTALLFGNAASLAYSAAGAILSMLVMTGTKRIKAFSPVGISVIGAVFHNVGQILMAIILTDTAQIAFWLPPLIISGVITGAAVGAVGAVLVAKIDPKLGK